MIKNLVIVGNGLDLHHGIKSGYSEFYDSGSIPEHLKEIYKILTTPYPEAKRWFDFEEEYRSLIQDENDILNIGGYDGIHTGVCPENAEKYIPRVDLINYVFQSLKELFLEYLTREYQHSKKRPSFTVDESVLKQLHDADLILNFNYTNTLQDLYNIADEKIVQVHGTIGKDAILGHSNYCRYDRKTGESDNYGFGMIIPEMREHSFQGDKHLQRIESWNNMKHSSGCFEENNPFDEITGGVVDNVRLIQNKSPLTMAFLNKTYERPFDEFVDERTNICYANKLHISFDADLYITVIGHGLQSDMDLLSKIPAKNKWITVFQMVKCYDKELMDGAKLVFDTEDVEAVEYAF